MENAQPRYAGFWIRFLANLIDWIILEIASWIPVFVIQAVLPKSYPMSSFFIQGLAAGFGVCFSFPYYTWGHYRWGTTLGKRPCGIYVVSVRDSGPISVWQSVVRTLGYVISYLAFGCGFLMVAFHPEKRGLHDLIAGTVSIRK